MMKIRLMIASGHVRVILSEQAAREVVCLYGLYDDFETSFTNMIQYDVRRLLWFRYPALLGHVRSK